VHSVLAFTVFGVDWEFIKPFVVLGFALGGVYALSGVSLVVLYRSTGVLNLAFGAIGTAGSLLAYWLLEHTSVPSGVAYLVAIGFGGLFTLAYGVILGPAFAQRDPLVKMMGTLAILLILLGVMAWRAPIDAATVRIITLESSDWSFQFLGVRVVGTQIIAIALAIALTAGITAFLRFTGLGTAMRALANDREISATLGVPVRNVEAAAWFGSGIICGAAGLLLADLLQTLDYTALTFLVSFALAAALIGGLNSLWGTLVGGLAIGIAQAVLNPYFSIAPYRRVAPFALAIIALLWLGRRRVVVISRSGR
jgi:branched-chain amino acid transport system permease protein